MSLGARFILEQTLHIGPVFTLHRARDLQLDTTVILKHLPPEHLTPASARRLRREYSMIRELDLPGVVKALDLCEVRDALSLVLADFGGESLESHLSRGRLPLSEFLAMAADLAQTLGHIHSRNVIHKDINPRNLLVSAERRTQVIDFGVATRLPREIQSITNPNVLEGTLAYISPEQTGRMNRAVDYRADLYSLGATFYTMLTGRPPFPTRDPVELLHAHIARRPEPPTALDPAIPQTVSAIVLKLLQKAPEDRYQSAFGLWADIEACRAQLRQEGRVAAFTLGQHDISERFQLPEKLYGREPELVALEAALGRVARGSPELFLISGASGVGKSALIQELQKSVVRNPGFFVTGKFDALKGDVPYSAILEALRALCEYLLAESEEELARRGHELRAAVGGVGRVLVDVLPELGLILGPQAPVEELPAVAAQNRFRFVFDRFLRALAPKGQPLVLFLDDLQWADSASLDILSHLLGEGSAGSLLVIGAYRDGELTAAHHLHGLIATVEKSGCRTTHVELGPLSVEGINRLLADTLSRDPAATRSLAEIVSAKTHGNAFFTLQFLTMLYKSDLLTFDPVRRTWTWDEAQIASAPITSNVVDLMTARAAELGEETRSALQTAACMGDRFDAEALSLLHEQPAAQTERALAAAVEEGLIVSLGDSYRFLHDRVRLVLYESIPTESRAEIHHRIARRLLSVRQSSAEAGEDGLFELLQHANLAAPFFQAPGERLELARLNFAAGHRARAAAALGPASAYFAAGTRLLPEDAWRREHQLAYELHLGSAEGALLSGREDSAERLFERVLRESADDLEKAQVHLRKAALYGQIGKMDAALDEIARGLALLGVDMPLRASTPALLLGLAKARRVLDRRTADDYLRLPELKDPRLLCVLFLFKGAIDLTYHNDQPLMALLTLHMTMLAVTRGSAAICAFCFLIYAMLEGRVLGDLERQAQYSRIGLAMLARYPDKALEAHSKIIYGGMIHPWVSPMRGGVLYLQEALQAGLESGNHVLAGYAMTFLTQRSLMAGYPLDESRERVERDLVFARKTGSSVNVHYALIARQSILALQGLTRSTQSFDTDEYDERVHTEQLTQSSVRILIHHYHCHKLRVLWVLEHYEDALALCERAEKKIYRALNAPILITDYVHYSSLTYAACSGPEGSLTRQQRIWAIRRNQRKMRKWAWQAPSNFHHKLMLVEAELARLTGDDHAAIQQYEAALAGARQHRFLQDEAIALELAGRFYLSRGLQELGAMHLARARDAYDRWGAHAKVVLLQRARPEIRGAVRLSRRSTPPPVSVTATTASARGSGAFDAPTLIKATQALSSEISLDRLLSRLMQIAVESAGAERGVLLLKPDGTDELGLSAEVSPEQGTTVHVSPALVELGQHLSLGILQYVTRTQRSVVLRDAAGDGAFTRDPYVLRQLPRSILCIPLLQHREVRGVLYLENNLTTGAFTEERVQLLQVLCAQMTISIENASLYADLEAKVVARTRELREAQARMVKLEREATEVQMAGGFAHEMLNALSGAKTLVETLIDAADKPLRGGSHEALDELSRWLTARIPPDEQAYASERLQKVSANEARLARLLFTVDRALARGLRITTSILEYSQLGRRTPGRELVPLLPLVRSILDDASPELTAHGIVARVEIAPELTLQGRKEHLAAIVTNLTRNACDALAERDDGAPRELRITALEEPERWVLCVADTGAGILPEHRDRIFTPFFSTQPATRTGLGLGTVEKLVSIYKGTIAFDSEPGRGTRFTVTLPRQG